MTSVARQPPTPPYPTHYSQWSKKPEPSITAPSTSSVTTSALDDQTDSESESDYEAIPQAQFKRRNFVCAITVGGARRAPGFTQHVSELLNFEPFSLGEPEKEDALDEALHVEVSADAVDFVMPENIVGTRAMKRKIKRVLERYAQRFRKTVAKEAANMKPMVSKWTLRSGKIAKKRLGAIARRVTQNMMR